jgi:hypothetical protein
MINNILKKIEKANEVQNVELEKHEIDLALVDDLKATLNSLENQIFIDEEIISKTIKISSDLSLLNEKAKERITTNDGIVQSSFKKIQLAEKFIAQSERIAKELGVDVKTITNFNSVITAKNNAQDNIKTLSKEQNKLKNLVK